MATHSSILAWRTHGQRRLAGYSPYHPKELDPTKATEQARMQNWLAMLQLLDLSLEGVSPPALCLCGAWGYSECRPCTWTTLELWILKCLPCLTLVLALLCSSASFLAAVRWGVAHPHSPGRCCFLDFVLEPMTESSASVSIILFLWLHLYNSKLCQPQWPLCPQGWGVGEGVVNLWDGGSFYSGPDPGRPPSSSPSPRVLLNLCQSTIPEPPWVRFPVPKQVSLWRLMISLGCVMDSWFLSDPPKHFWRPQQFTGLCHFFQEVRSEDSVLLPHFLSLCPFLLPVDSTSPFCLVGIFFHHYLIVLFFLWSQTSSSIWELVKNERKKKKQVIRTQSKPSKS